MSRGARLASAAGLVLLAAAIGWTLLVALPRWTAPAEPGPSDVTPREPEPVSEAAPRIKARLFYLSADGLRLEPHEHDVPLGQTRTEQARHLVEAQLRAPEAPLLSAVPAGTSLKELFLTERGEAYVDLGPEIVASHPGGSLDELLTVYTLVAVLTENLAGVTRVQLLVDGREVDTLAGHVDLRRPIARAPEFLAEPAASGPAPVVD